MRPRRPFDAPLIIVEKLARFQASAQDIMGGLLVFKRPLASSADSDAFSFLTLRRVLYFSSQPGLRTILQERDDVLSSFLMCGVLFHAVVYTIIMFAPYLFFKAILYTSTSRRSSRTGRSGTISREYVPLWPADFLGCKSV